MRITKEILAEMRDAIKLYETSGGCWGPALPTMGYVLQVFEAVIDERKALRKALKSVLVTADELTFSPASQDDDRAALALGEDEE